MSVRIGQVTRTLVLSAFVTLVSAPLALALPGGITSNIFGPTGCNTCHFGGTAPVVTLTGPTTVSPGSTNEYTLTILSDPAQNFGGLNVRADDGTFGVGGGNATNTQTLLNGTSGRLELTHSSPKMADPWNMVSFSFLWTAPASFTSVTLNGWGNAVNLNSSTSGDAAAFDALEVFSDSVTPTPTPTPTATPVTCAGDLEPLKPFLVADPDQQDCQEAIAKAGFVYLKKDLKAVQKCLKKFHKGQLSGDPLGLCVGTASAAPADSKTAGKLALAEAKLSATIDTKCTDATVAPLRVCADTVAGLKTCLVDLHRQRVVDAIAAQYGTLVASTDAGEQKCQAAIAGAAGKYLSAYVRAGQKCLNRRNQDCLTGNAAALCLGSVAGGVFIPPTDLKTAEKLAKAEGKLRAKIDGKCSDAQVAALGTCGETRAAVKDCIVCAHRAGAFDAIGDQYGGAEGFGDTPETLQAAIDAASPGDTVMLDVGVYSGTAQVTVDGLKLIGQKSCSGERAVLVNPGGAANGIVASGFNDLLFEGFQVEDFDANDIFVTNADGVTFRDMITTGPGTDTGTEYGVFPILSNNVLVEDCVVSGVRDAGIYVGQSTNIVVRNNEVFGNVAGIEIENSANAEVYGNHAHDNTGGILVFKLPGLGVQLSNCHVIRDNTITNNNVPNFGSGTVGLVPQGTGILVLSNDTSIFRNNLITGNNSIGLAITDQTVLNLLFDPDPFPMVSPDFRTQGNFIYDNIITSNGTMPDPFLGGVSGDVVWVNNAATGNCQAMNIIGTDLGAQFGALPICTLPPVIPGCPMP